MHRYLQAYMDGCRLPCCNLKMFFCIEKRFFIEHQSTRFSQAGLKNISNCASEKEGEVRLCVAYILACTSC